MTIVRQLEQLARWYGVQTVYYDVHRQRRRATVEALLRVVRALGAPVATLGDVPAALRERRQQAWRNPIEPILLAWQGWLPAVPLRLPRQRAVGPASLRLQLEQAEERHWSCDLSKLETAEAEQVEDVSYVRKRLPGASGIAPGYHKLSVDIRAERYESLVISAPQTAYSDGHAAAERLWGLYVPLYALHSAGSWGGGDLGDLETLWRFTAELGGRLVATLPLLPAFLDELYDPSPYAPVSQLFWNEFYLELRRVPELRGCEAARGLYESADIQRQLEALRSQPLVDYRRQMALKRQVLQAGARCCYTKGGDRRVALQRFVTACPQVEDYARFRAACETQRRPWTQWPARLRDGPLREGDYDEADFRYHVYVQWLAAEQIRELSEKLHAQGRGLYLDLPLGVNRHGYDPWREREAFVGDVSGGAPPDAVFTRGQNWGFAPLHPERLRAQRYRHLIACLRHHLRHAGMLRIDHVMGLHRLYWVPEGMEARDGAYVQYPADELYAILCLESHRYRSHIVGENLGTVPSQVNRSLRRHAIKGMYVVQYELAPKPGPAPGGLKPPKRAVVASINTHDMPPFAAYWRGLDLDDLHALGLFDDQAIQVERANRQAIRDALVVALAAQGRLQTQNPCAEQVLDALHEWLAAGPADVLLINLEDLWLETEPQNTPGTSIERANWQRKTREPLELLVQRPGLRERLDRIGCLRQPKPITRPR